MAEEIEIIHAKTQIEMFGNPVDGWYTYADQADDPMFDRCTKIPMDNKVFIRLDIPDLVWLTGFYKTYENRAASHYSPRQNNP